MALQEDVALLAALPPFKPFTEDALRLLAFSSDSRILRQGDVLFRAGQMSQGAYLVRTGSLTLVTAAEPDEILVQSGDLIGESELILESKFAFTAVAREASSVLHLPRSAVRKVLQEFPEVAAGMRNAIAGRLADLHGRMVHVRNLLGPASS